jgi:ParB family chromosome partitioning protein
MTAEKTPRRLGRGLEALLGQKAGATGKARAPEVGEKSGSASDGDELNTLRDIPVNDINANHYQPRKEFNPDELAELQESIRSAGLLQPITVRKTATGGYELVAGERRLRAVKALGWARIPAIVRDYDDQTSLTLALVENLQREDLNPIEEGEGYARLSHEFGLSQNEIAELVGKDRSTIANLVRVLQLPADVRRMVESGSLTLGHVRALLALDDHEMVIKLAQEAIDHDLSVRAMEERVRRDVPRAEKPRRGRPRKEDTRPPEVRHVEDMLRRRLQTDVNLVTRKNETGEVRIQFYSTDDLNRLLELLGASE